MTTKAEYTRAEQLEYLRSIGLSDQDYARLGPSALLDDRASSQRPGIESRAGEVEVAEPAPESEPDKDGIALTFSSEARVERWWGIEILDHSPGSIRMDRAKTGLPLLLNHDRYMDPLNHVGRVEGISFGEGRKGRGMARFGRGARAQEVRQDVLDGIRPDVSVSYAIYRMVLVEQREDLSVYRVVDWEPEEVSLVPVPADVSVGVGRDKRDRKEGALMPDEVKTVEPAAPAAPAIDVRAERESIRQAELARINQIRAIGERLKLDELATEFINGGKSVDEFRAAAIDKMGNASPLVPVKEGPEIGLTEKEAQRFSLLRMLDALANPSDQSAQRAAAFEFEACRAAAGKVACRRNGMRIPFDALKVVHEANRMRVRRDLMSDNMTYGASWIGTTLVATDFISLLRNKMITKELGARVMDGLVGDLAIAKQTGGATAYWVKAGGTITESTLTSGAVLLNMKTVAGTTDVDRALLKQASVDCEAFVRDDLAQVLAIAQDAAAIAGAGTPGTPLGIIYQTGIGDVAGGTNGATPTDTHTIKLEEQVSVDNALVGAMAYLANAKTVKELKIAKTNATYGEIPVWQGDPARPGFGVVNGYKAAMSNQVPSTLTKGSASGTCSALIFGNWNDLIIGGWGGIEFVVDPYTNAKTGMVNVTAYLDTDVNVRHVESFAAMLDVLTTS